MGYRQDGHHKFGLRIDTGTAQEALKIIQHVPLDHTTKLELSVLQNGQGSPMSTVITIEFHSLYAEAWTSHTGDALVKLINEHKDEDKWTAVLLTHEGGGENGMVYGFVEWSEVYNTLDKERAIRARAQAEAEINRYQESPELVILEEEGMSAVQRLRARAARARAAQTA